MGLDVQPTGEAVGASQGARYFSVALVLHERRCLVVGGGPVAARKVQALLHAGAVVTVVAPEISPRLEAMGQATPGDSPEPPMGTISAKPVLRIERRPFQPSDLDDAYLVVTATDDPSVTKHVVEVARARGILVNAADDPANCDFILPAVVHRGDIQIAITTGGRSPALARHLRERLEREVPAEYGPLADVLAEVRADLRHQGIRASAAAWQRAITDDVLASLRVGDTLGAQSQIRDALTPSRLAGEGRGEGEESNTSDHPANQTRTMPGRIVLVGAGPGDPGLLTVAGQRAIAGADVIVYDRLVNTAVLEGARTDARIVYAGKSRGGGPMSQEEINELICDEARAGNVVVRLKGGDPFVFGRGGEEALAAVEASIPFTVIPGITAAIAAPAYVGIPVTHRGMASTFTVLTGHEDPSKATTSLDWEFLARAGGTLVLLMGVDTLPAICSRLVEAGLAPDTPAAVVQNATRDTQRAVTGALADIAERARAAGIAAPATTIIGQVVGLAGILAWWQTDCENPAAPSHT